MPCRDCTLRELCSELCPEAELIVAQNEVTQKELPIGMPKYGRFPELLSNVYLTKREKQIVTLLGQGMERGEICELLEITRENCRKIIQRLRQKCHEFYYK